jgi:hypothetical protein
MSSYAEESMRRDRVNGEITWRTQRRGSGNDADLGFPCPYLLCDIFQCAPGASDHLYTRMRSEEATDELGKRIDRLRRHGADDETPADESVDGVDRCLGEFDLMKHFAGDREQGFASRGEDEATPGAVKQLTADVLFERSHRLRNGRLRDEERLRGAVHTSFGDDGEEVSQLSDVHAHPLSIGFTYHSDRF